MCRVWQHAWDYTTAQKKGGEWVQGLACMRCGTERYVRIDSRSGERKGNRYTYAKGYLLGGGGGLTADERAELRLEEVGGHFRRRRSR